MVCEVIMPDKINDFLKKMILYLIVIENKGSLW